MRRGLALSIAAAVLVASSVVQSVGAGAAPAQHAPALMPGTQVRGAPFADTVTDRSAAADTLGGDTLRTGSMGSGGISGSRPADTLGHGTSRPWYDTLTLTQPRYARIAPYERLALAAFTAVSIPIGIAIGVTTILPPSINVLAENGVTHTGIAVSSGVGLVSDTSAFIFFPDVRFQFEGGYYIQRERPAILRLAVLRDAPLLSIHERDFFWLGVAGGGGVSTDFDQVGPFAEAWLGIMNPMGIRFLSLFPMHHYGVRARAGYGAGRAWYELSLSATSTFWF